jgi:ribokinase
LAEAGVQLDMLVSSSRDAGERYTSGSIDPPPRLVARTAGAAGGWVEALDGQTTAWTAAPLPGPPVDTYGAGDCFAAGLTYGLADRRSPQDAALGALRCRVRDRPGAVRGQLAGDG